MTVVPRLGGEFVADKTTFGWWGTFVGDSAGLKGVSVEDYGKCLHEIKVAGTNPKNGSTGPWSIGVVKALDGDGYQLRYDYYGGAGHALHKTFGDKLTKIADEYAAEVAIRQLARQGFRTTRMDAPLATVR